MCANPVTYTQEGDNSFTLYTKSQSIHCCVEELRQIKEWCHQILATNDDLDDEND